MQSALINTLGNWNPQLLRELRGRLKPRSVLAAVSLSVIVQVVLYLACIQEDSTISLLKQWRNLWTSLTWIFPYVLFTLGSYYIVSDITQEEKRGTLNFIRLSPRPAEEILIGKLLGVPVLPYITVASAIPLHCIAAFVAGISLQFMISFYLLLIAGCAFCYSVAMLYGLLGSRQKAFISQEATTAVAAAAIAFLLFCPIFMFWNIYVNWIGFPQTADIFEIYNTPQVYWAYSEITQNLIVSHGFTLGNIAISIALMWGLLLRRFRQPYSTVISKRQSYLIFGYLEILGLGFCLTPKLTINFGDLTGASIVLFAFTVGLLLIITFGVCPQRQALLDWSRYPSKNWLSWVWADKSPALLSMGIHVLMANAILLPWTLIAGVGTKQPVETIIAFIGVSNILLIYGVLIQQIQAANIRNPNLWVVGGLSVWLIVPPTILSLMGLLPKEIPVTTTLWTVLGYPFWHFDQPETLIFTVFGILIQWLVLGGLLWQFRQTLEDLQDLHSFPSAK